MKPSKQAYTVSVLLAMAVGLVVAYLTGQPVTVTIPAPLLAGADAVDAPLAVTEACDATATALPAAVTP